jgi:hypothetical protein
MQTPDMYAHLFREKVAVRATATVLGRILGHRQTSSNFRGDDDECEEVGTAPTYLVD